MDNTTNIAGNDAGKLELDVNDEEHKKEDCAKENFSRGLSTRIRVENFPPFFGMKQVRKFLKDNLDGMESTRLKTMPRGVAIFSLSSEENATRALALLNQRIVKKFQLAAKRVAEEPTNLSANGGSRNERSSTTHSSTPVINAAELVTPLSGLAYADQLQRKAEASRAALTALLRQIASVGVPHARQWVNFLNSVLPSPIITGYRNKCEFCVARCQGEIRVGFVQGRMSEREICVVDPADCTNLTRNTLAILRRFENFVRNFDARLDAFDEFKRVGFWKMLTVRDFHGDCMLVVTAHPHSDEALVQNAKTALIDLFLLGDYNKEVSFEFRVTSLYWQTIDNASDPKVYELLAGTPYIYETLLGVRFQISPSTFFQTNSRAAEVLYTVIGDALNLPKLEPAQAACVAISVQSYAKSGGQNEPKNCVENAGEKNSIDAKANENEPNESNGSLKRENVSDDRQEELDGDGPLDAKKPCIPQGDSTSTSSHTTNSIVLLDICCGAGSIGLCLMKRLRDAFRLKKFPLNVAFGTVGVELVPNAICDAKINAFNNGFSDRNCRYITGRAEKIFTDLKHYMPEGCVFDGAKLLGVLDPPRAGVPDKVIIGCRKLEQMRRLVYVSCDPRAATKNLVDLCRPRSNKYEGPPFRIAGIQPVDMFPQTEHVEWVVTLERD